MQSCRHFVADTLRTADFDYPRRVWDDLLLCASELATNAIRHTRSGEEEGVFTAVLYLRRAWVGLEVQDLGPREKEPTVPSPLTCSLDDPLATAGRGLAMIGLCSRGRYGFAAPPDAPVYSTWCALAA
ncbi:ATP-binding protein [Marinactinospora rubrisoli]|uniref:ATP-binding protein n=1 Tax=Marinactinospora rubrisoli TaxID=2715399 RepID=A0ABW2KEL1_9ACTN